MRHPLDTIGTKAIPSKILSEAGLPLTDERWQGVAAYSGSLSLHTGETETLLHRVISRYHRVPHYPFRVMDCASTYRIIGINLELHKLVNSTDLFIQFQKVDQGSSSLGNHWSGYKLLRSVGRGT